MPDGLEQFGPALPPTSEFSTCTPLLEYRFRAAVPARLRAMVALRSSGGFVVLPLNAIALGVVTAPELETLPWLSVNVTLTSVAWVAPPRVRNMPPHTGWSRRWE